jgi:hypothetical protein
MNVVWKAVKANINKGLINTEHFLCSIFINYLDIRVRGEKGKEAHAGFNKGVLLMHLDAEPRYKVNPVKFKNNIILRIKPK